MKKILLSISLISLFFSVNSQTIPCPGFENWVNSNESGANYLIPQNWITSDQIQNAFSPGYTGISTVRTTSSYAGQYAAMMQTVIMGNDTVAGGMISTPSVAGFLNALFNGVGSIGYSHTTRPANLQGYFKFTKTSGDTGYIGIQFTKWNSTMQTSDLVAEAEMSFGTNTANYTLFSMPITYSLNVFPDTALIVASIDGPNGAVASVGTQFFLDDLTFTGSVPIGIKETADRNDLIRLYPNPFSETATLELTTSMSLNEAKVILFDGLGNEVRVIKDIKGYMTRIDREGLQSGIYFYRLVNEGGILASGKFLIE